VDTKAKIGLGLGGAVIALGAAVGVGVLAANIGGTDTATTQTGGGQDGPSGRGTGARGGMDTAALAKTLATKLGVDETTMASALKEVMAANRPSGAPSGQPSGQPSGAPSGQPTGAPSGKADGNRPGGSAYIETMAKALATKLNLDEAKVLTALQEAMTAQR
jgi:hypothetical protein